MTLDDIFKTISLTQNKQKYIKDITKKEYFGFPMKPLIEVEQRLLNSSTKNIAYFSMEFGLSTTIYNLFDSQSAIDKKNYLSHHEVFSNMRAMDYYHVLPFDKLLDLPIYSGGLGVLAGDCLKSASDKKIPLVGIGIMWNKGYFNQKLWFKYGQIDEEIHWDPCTYPGLIKLDNIISVKYANETIKIQLWKYPVYSHDKKFVVPLILLDSNVEGNSKRARQFTDQLYRSDDDSWKIAQRFVLGIGGVKALEELGYMIDTYHLNEGHAAFAFLEKASSLNGNSINSIKNQFVYTCHTPVEAGHDRFSFSEVSLVLDEKKKKLLEEFGKDPHRGDVANLTYLAMNTSNKVNAVAVKHGEITRLQFPFHKDKINTVTNGVHTYTWVSNSFSKLFDKYIKEIGDWHKDPSLLKNVLQLKDNKSFRKDIWDAHIENKGHLADFFKSWLFKRETFTLCWARRIAPYKRPSLIFHDTQRLVDIAKRVGHIQIIIAGKAHPNDDRAFTYINDIMQKIDKLSKDRKVIKVALLENYNTYIGKFLTSNVDVWLNNPLPPFEASGTSGMKAILNGVVQLSTLDGWVVESADKNIGKIFGYVPKTGDIGDENDYRLQEDSQALYDSLEELVSEYYSSETQERQGIESEWIDKMISCVSEAGFFNTDRMVEDYKNKIWVSK